MLNEELDPKLMIQKLKREILQLKEELAMATGEQRTDDLSAEDLERSVDLPMGGSRRGDRRSGPSPPPWKITKYRFLNGISLAGQ